MFPLKRLLLLFTGLLAVLLSASSVKAEPLPYAVLQGLDKVTARVTTLSAAIGETVKFGNLEIIARICDKRPPEETPESAAFLDIWEVKDGIPAQSLFRGWMFASSPALNAMEHPVYDVWVLDCSNEPAVRKRPVIQGLDKVIDGENPDDALGADQ